MIAEAFGPWAGGKEAEGRTGRAGRSFEPFWAKGDTTSRSPARLSAQGQRGRQCVLPEAQKVLGARCSTLDTTSRNHNALGAQGRRGREADPDSRSASERGGRAAGPKSPANKVGVIWWSTAK